MLRPSIVRQILRVRSARACARSYYDYVPPSPPDLPPLSDPSFDGISSRPFPMYSKPIPPPPEEDFDISSLPSDTYIQKGAKIRLTRKVVEDTPELDEEDLRSFYRGLVESSREDGVLADVKQIGAPGGRRRLRLGRVRREEVLARLQERLLGAGPSGRSASLAHLLPVGVKNAPMRVQLAVVLSSIGSQPTLGTAGLLSSVKGKEKAGTGQYVPLGLLSRTEWEAILEDFIERKDARGAEAFLKIMGVSYVHYRLRGPTDGLSTQRHGVQADMEDVDEIIVIDAKAGRSEEVARLGSEIVTAGLPFDAVHHDAFVTSLLRASPSQVESAMTYLREYEKRGQPLPQSTYNLILSHLLVPTATSHPTSHTRSLAWDIFSHMRLVAHPTPSREIYTTMIRACGDARNPQPERARDLWTEMTSEGEEVVPRRVEYDAIIRALSSTKTDYLEAFELLRQMIARHQDAVLLPFEDEPRNAWSEFVPTVETFTALLEGTKRAGDLERARWMLSQLVGLVKSSVILGDQRLKGPDEEMMTGIFMTYASWKPKMRRSNVKIRENEERSSNENEESDDLGVDVLADTQSTDTMATSRPDYDAPPYSPQTSADAIHESTALFETILSAASLPTSHPARDEASMGDVHLNTRLINSYLSIHLSHAPSIAAARDVWDSTWNRVKKMGKKVVPNGWSFLHVLERCSAGSRGGVMANDRTEAQKWGEETWRNHRLYVDVQSLDSQHSQQAGAIHTSAASSHSLIQNDVSAQRRKRWLLGLGERQVERCWRSIIRLYALSDDLTTSMDLLDQFHILHPPSAIVQGYSPLPETDLSIRMSSVDSVPEPDVPPHLMWKDLDVLHQKLVRDENSSGLAKVKWVTKAYEGALMKRRRFRLKGVGVARERKKEESRAMSRVGRNLDMEKVEVGDEESEDLAYHSYGSTEGEDIEGLRATG